MKSIPLVFVLILLMQFPLFAEISVKIRGITKIDGLKENQVYGYGLVVGLPGTGDSRSGLAKVSLKNFLKNLGMEPETFKSKNVAAVLLTANLPAFVRVGDRINITVSSIGDAKSLEGGILIQSPLRGADGNVYVAAQGTLEASISNGKNRGVKTVARISGGGVVERNLVPQVVVENTMYLVLERWDYGVADRIIKAVRKKYPTSKPEITPDGKIKLTVIPQIPLHEFVATIQNMEIAPGDRARVVINEKDGTIVAGGNIRISEAMVSREGLMVEIANSDKKQSTSLLKESSTVKDLVDALNAVGASTGDIISIMKALKNAGALHAEVIIQ